MLARDNISMAWAVTLSIFKVRKDTSNDKSSFFIALYFSCSVSSVPEVRVWGYRDGDGKHQGLLQSSFSN